MDEKPASSDPRQYSIRALLVLTISICVLLAIGSAIGYERIGEAILMGGLAGGTIGLTRAIAQGKFDGEGQRTLAVSNAIMGVVCGVLIRLILPNDFVFEVVACSIVGISVTVAILVMLRILLLTRWSRKRTSVLNESQAVRDRVPDLPATDDIQ